MSLHHCADKGLPKMAYKLLDAGADPNIQDNNGSIPLFLALYGKSWEMVEILLEASDLSLSNNEGLTALHLVVDQYQNPLCPRALVRLIKLGVNINAQTKEFLLTPLVLSTQYHDWDVFEMLIKAGADVNLACTGGYTALNKIASLSDGDEGPASPEQRVKLVEILIKQGVDVDGGNITDAHTPLTEAVQAGNLAIVRQLLQANCSGKLSREKNYPNFMASYLDREVARFMQTSVKKGVTDCATFIFGEACRAEDQDLRQHFLRLSHLPEASVNGKTIELCRPPYSLFSLSRIAVRAALPKGPAFLAAVDQLPLPILVKDFVAFRQ